MGPGRSYTGEVTLSGFSDSGTSKNSRQGLPSVAAAWNSLDLRIHSERGHAPSSPQFVQQLLSKISDPADLQKHIGLDAATRGADLKLLMAQRREIAKLLSA